MSLKITDTERGETSKWSRRFHVTYNNFENIFEASGREGRFRCTEAIHDRLKKVWSLGIICLRKAVKKTEDWSNPVLGLRCVYNILSYYYARSRSTVRGSGLNASKNKTRKQNAPTSVADGLRRSHAFQNLRYALSIRKSRCVRWATVRRDPINAHGSGQDKCPPQRGYPPPQI